MKSAGGLFIRTQGTPAFFYGRQRLAVLALSTVASAALGDFSGYYSVTDGIHPAANYSFPLNPNDSQSSSFGGWTYEMTSGAGAFGNASVTTTLAPGAISFSLSASDASDFGPLAAPVPPGNGLRAEFSITAEVDCIINFTVGTSNTDPYGFDSGGQFTLSSGDFSFTLSQGEKFGFGLVATFVPLPPPGPLPGPTIGAGPSPQSLSITAFNVVPVPETTPSLLGLGLVFAGAGFARWRRARH